MTTTVHFGDSRRWQVAVDSVTILAAESQANPAIDDLVAAMGAALARPTGFPALAAATVPGDHVAVMLEEGVPRPAAIVRGAVAALLDAGVDPSLVTVVTASPLEQQAELEREFSANGAAGVRFERHDPDDEKAIAMVGITRSGEALRLNRTIAEADFVLPIAAGRLQHDDEAPCRYEGFFPQFSSREAANRWRTQSASESAKERRKAAKEVDEAGWLAGILMTVSVVQGAGGEVAAVLAGDPAAVTREAADRARAIWERSLEHPGDLVIAALSGDQREQTWDNVARAVTAAASVVRPGGAIAVCSALATLPSGPLNRLKGAVDFGEVQEKLAHDDSSDAHPARVLAQALDSGPLYLCSDLPAEIVESMGMTPIENEAELARLAAGREHCVVIQEAQRVGPRLLKREPS